MAFPWPFTTAFSSPNLWCSHQGRDRGLSAFCSMDWQESVSGSRNLRAFRPQTERGVNFFSQRNLYSRGDDWSWVHCSGGYESLNHVFDSISARYIKVVFSKDITVAWVVLHALAVDEKYIWWKILLHGEEDDFPWKARQVLRCLVITWHEQSKI